MFIFYEEKPRIVPSTKTIAFNKIIRIVTDRLSSVQIRSEHRNKPYRATSTLELSLTHVNRAPAKANIIKVKIPFQTKYISVSVIALACGFTLDEFVQLVKISAGRLYSKNKFDPFETAILFHRQGGIVHTQRDAIMVISKVAGKNLLSTGLNILLNECFPHLHGDRTISVQPANAERDLEKYKELLRTKGMSVALCSAVLILFASENHHTN